MALARCVNVGVLAIVRDELVVIGKGDANKKVERGVHSKKIHAEVEVAFVLVRIKRGDTEREIAHDVGNELRCVICHEDTVVERKRYSFKVHKSNDLRAEEIHLGTFVECGVKEVVVCMNSSAFERTCRECAGEVDVVHANGTDVLR